MGEPNLSKTEAELTNQAAQTDRARKAQAIACAGDDQSLLVDGLYARAVDRWPLLPSIQPDQRL